MACSAAVDSWSGVTVSLSRLHQAGLHTGTSRAPADAQKVSGGLGSKLAHCHFHCVLLCRAHDKAPPIHGKGKLTAFGWEELKGTLKSVWNKGRNEALWPFLQSTALCNLPTWAIQVSKKFGHRDCHSHEKKSQENSYHKGHPDTSLIAEACYPISALPPSPTEVARNKA